MKAEDPLIILESDKASMEVPSPSAGVVKSVLTKVGDKVAQGTPILTLETRRWRDGGRGRTREAGDSGGSRADECAARRRGGAGS